jgi:hypothetical protein
MDARALSGASGGEFDGLRRTRRHGPRQRCAVGVLRARRDHRPPPSARRKVNRLRDIDTLPSRLAEAIAEVELDDDGRPRRIKLHDKLAALTVLIKHGEISSGETRSAIAQSAYGHDEISGHDDKQPN